MKIKIQKKDSPLQFMGEISNSLNLKNISPGEKFSVRVFEGTQQILMEAIFLADKRSLLLSDKTVVRLSSLPNLNIIQTQIVRPIEPKKSNIKKGLGDLKSPMTGKIISVLVKNSDEVKPGDTLVVIEAMKMENRILSQAEGVVKNIKISLGDKVNSGDILLTLTEQK